MKRLARRPSHDGISRHRPRRLRALVIASITAGGSSASPACGAISQIMTRPARELREVRSPPVRRASKICATYRNAGL